MDWLWESVKAKQSKDHISGKDSEVKQAQLHMMRRGVYIEGGRCC